MNLGRKDLLGLKELDKEEIIKILDVAAEMKKILSQGVKRVPHLQNKSVVTLFYENSTRTRMSFELAGKFLSASVSNIAVSNSSVQKGESLIDTGKTLDALMTDVVIIRHYCSGAPHLLAKNIKARVINAGDGMNEHPTQALLDMFTMREKVGHLKGLKVTIIGDIKHSRVARSNIIGLNKLGAQVTLTAPKTLLPYDIERMGAQVKPLNEAVKDADVIMSLRMQMERQLSGLIPSRKEYGRFYALTEDVLNTARKDVYIMHPGPMNRGIELSSELADSPQSVINEQVTNGVAVRMAVLFLLTRGGKR
ncbi:MAG: aspartate carbamoyltransferase catalytic subunit [Bacillota bacterium]|jgi:aspartate carbamoyltransferase catalytic subunit|nr:aspartate carbamoyltransferase catalytic subunit [Bacillota bacterium]HHU42814.1 aspartate carbamoyltransferase catalytic subunit [Clostridiales bacterium]